MDLLCDNILEEILRCLPAKYLHRVRAVSRRYNDIVRSSGFVGRYWQSHSPYLSGVFLQTDSVIRPWGHFPGFLAGSPRPSATESVFALDLGFLPHLPESRLQPETMSNAMIFIVHSTAGLLLCSKGRNNAVQYYVCNPVSWQCVSLPKLPWRSYHLYGLLSVTDNGDGIVGCFQVFLFNHPTMWHQTGGCMDLKVFSSDTGQWRQMRIQYLPLVMDGCLPPFLGQNGTIYLISCRNEDRAIVYNCNHNSIWRLPLPSRVDNSVQNRCIGERGGGALRYAHFDFSVFEVWDLQVESANDMWWSLVHRVGVMELAQQNLEAATRVANKLGRQTIEACINSNSLFSVLGFHPTEDIIFMDMADTVASYSIEHGTMQYQCPRRCFRQDIFPYVHPAHPVHIPSIKLEPLEYKLF